MNTIKEDIFEEAVNALRTLDESGLKSVVGYIKRLAQRYNRKVAKKRSEPLENYVTRSAVIESKEIIDKIKSGQRTPFDNWEDAKASLMGQGMKYTFDYTRQFKKDYRALNKSDMEEVDKVIQKLLNGVLLDAKYSVHALKGEYKGCIDCHIRPDLVLIYRIDKDILVMTAVRVGSHSKLF